MNTFREKYPDLPALWAAIRKRPGMFLGEKALRGLQCLLMGMEFAENYHEIPKGSRVGGFDMEAFEKWIDSTHNPQRLSLRSTGLAERVAGSDAEAFDLWFRWYDEYQANRDLR